MQVFLSCGGAGPRAGFGAGGLDAARGLIADQFAAVLSRLGEVVRIDTADEGVRAARDAGEGAVHVCVALPHELPPDAGAETVAAFGLSLATCPDAPFAGDPRTDWRLRLACCGGALCFSTHAAAAVQALMGATCPVLTAPIPVACAPGLGPPAPATLQVGGAVLDTALWPRTAPPDRALCLAGDAALPAGEAGGPETLEANPPPVKSLRYRLGVTRLHVAYLYREVVRDMLPAPVAGAVARAGRLGVRVARRVVVGRPGAVSALPSADLDFAPPPTGEEAALWRNATSLALDGFVCAAVHGGWDRSWGELLSAWVEVTRHDPAATLVVKSAGLDQDTRNGLAGTLRRLGPFDSRVVILDGEIEGGLDALVAASAFYVCASVSEAAPLPLQRFLAAGRPAVSPDHSALADLIDAETGFVVASGLEYESWPGDVEERLAATGWRLDWESLCAGIVSARALWHRPEDYAARASAVAVRTRQVCGPDAVLSALRGLGAPAPAARARPIGGRPVILVHSETDAGTLATRLGTAEYSYFFVLRFFRPVLERIGRVVPVADPAREVDRLYAQATARGEPCVFLSFSPPHRTPTGLACPTVPVFAWEFDTIPQEHWGGERRHDWARVLRTLGCAIVHSQATVATVRDAVGSDFPVWSIPAPVWDSFAPAVPHAPLREATLSIRGTVLDTAAMDMASLRHDENWFERVHAERAQRGPICEVKLEGVVYSSVFNPEDGRKNWIDMLAAFCRVFNDQPAATLVLKLTHHDGTWGMALMLRHLRRLMPFSCRVVLMHGFLPDADYMRFTSVTTFAVNTSHGEGQCLPLMEAMSAGKPAVAPPHTGMTDYLDADCAFLVRSSAEPGSWPQDTRFAVRTHRRRIDLHSLEAAFRTSYEVATRHPQRYAAMSSAATERLRRHCSAGPTEERLRTAFASLLGQRFDVDYAETAAACGSLEAEEGIRLPRDYAVQLAERIAKLAHYQTVAPPDLANYQMFDPSETTDMEFLAVNYGFEVQASPGNAIFIHRAARKALANTPVRIGGFGNALLIDADCTMHGSIDMTGDFNLALFEGGQSYLAIGATFYGGDTLVWGRGASSWGIRVWVQGGVTCAVGEGSLFSENITIRCTDHHSIFDLDTGAQINKPLGVTIGRHVWVGQDCAISKGATIEDGAIIGARSLVVGRVGRAELWAGSPARKLRERVSWTLPHPVLDPEERDAVTALLNSFSVELHDTDTLPMLSAKSN